MCVCLQSLQDDGDIRRPDEHGRYGPRKVSSMVFIFFALSSGYIFKIDIYKAAVIE